MTIHTDRLTTPTDRYSRGGVPLDPAIPQAAVHRVLDSGRRREVLRCLLAEDGSLEVRTLVARIADAEHDATTITSLLDLRQRVHVSLCRTHLPLLENHRILSYDRANGLVSPGATLPTFESLLELDALEESVASRLDPRSE